MFYHRSINSSGKFNPYLRRFMPAVSITFWFEHKKFKKIKKNVKPSHCVMLCDLVVRKIIKLDYCKYCRNPFSEMTYHVGSFMAFKPDELGHDPNHRIFCSNDPILCTCVLIGMENKVHIGSFYFLCIKN
jgi:hypothetical protein